MPYLYGRSGSQDHETDGQDDEGSQTVAAGGVKATE
jgi:hypothetical protein